MTKTRLLTMFGVSAIAAAAVIYTTAPASAAPAEKLTICHVDQDAEAPTSLVISVSANAWQGHQAHGDQITLLPVGTPDCLGIE